MVFDISEFRTPTEEELRKFNETGNYKYVKGCLEDFHKIHESDKIWWTCRMDRIGSPLFSFDKKKIYSVFPTEANDLSEEEARILRKENPIMASFAGY